MAKAGRKKKAGVIRSASGRPSRAASAYQEDRPGIEARMRQHGLREVDAKDPRSATFIGRLYMKGFIRRAQYDAAQTFIEIREQYMRAVRAPEALRSPSNGGEPAESNEYADWCRRAIERYDAAADAVQEVQNIYDNRGRMLFAALDYLVIRDEEHWHMAGDVRLSLNALAHHFGFERRQVPS